MYDFENLFKSLNGIKVAIIGDVMLDTYWWGHVDRISPEAPVPIVSLDKKELRIGGAGNVALNTVALGASTTLFSVTGNDEDQLILVSLLREKNIDTQYIVKSDERITTNKTRILSRNQQMMRLDAEMTSDINEADEEALISAFKRYAETEKPAIVIFEDYNKGVLTNKVIAEILNICNSLNIITAVDPKRKNFFSYKGVTIFKPNLAEVKTALNLLPEDINEAFLQDVHTRLHAKLDHEISLITLSEKGIFYEQQKRSEIIPTHIRSIADVSGAGDTVIAVASLVYAATKDIKLSAALANVAGGMVCEEVGTVAIDKQKLLTECTQLLAGSFK